MPFVNQTASGSRVAVNPKGPPPAPPAPKPPPEPTVQQANRAFGPGPGSPAPFHQAQQQAAHAVAKATPAPRPVLPQFPVLKSYTPQQKQTIVQTQGKAIVQQAQQHGSGTAFYNQAAPEDQQQVRLYAQVVADLQHAEAVKQANGYAHLGLAADTPKGDFSTSPNAARGPAPDTTVGIPLIPGASINLSGIGRDLADRLRPAAGVPAAIAALATGSFAQPNGNILHNAAVDLGQLPAQTIASLYQTAKAGVQAAGGNTGPIKQIGQGLASMVEHPVASFEQHPVSTLLTAAGGEAAIGRLAGAAARTGALGSRVAELAATARPDLPIYGDLRMTGRTFSPDPLRKAVQVATEKTVRSAKGTEPGRPTATQLRHGLVGSPTQPGIVDQLVHSGEQARRNERGKAMGAVQVAKPKVGADAVRSIAEGVIRRPDTVVPDLQARVAALEAQQQHLQGGLLASNRDSVAKLKGLLANPKFLANPKPAFDAAHAFNDVHAPLVQRRIELGDLQPGEVRAALFPYAQMHMGAHYDPELGLVGPGGRPLSNAEVLQHAEGNGVHSIGFVSQSPTLLTPRSFFRSASRRPPVTSQPRTGQAFEQGTYPHGYESLVAQAAKSAGQVSGHEGYNTLLNALGVGNFEDTAMGHRAAENFLHTPEGQRIEGVLGKMQVVPKGQKQVIEAAKRTGNISIGPADEALQQLGRDVHRPFTESPDGRFTLMPEAVTKRIDAHNSALGTGAGARLMQVATQKFRSTALYTSPRWLVGSPQERGIRLVNAGAGPRSYIMGKRAEQAFSNLASGTGPESQMAKQAAASLLGGGVYEGAKQAELYRSGEQFLNTALEGPARRLEGIGNTQGVHQVIGAWNGWKGLVQRGMHATDRIASRAALGKAMIQDIQRFNGKWTNVLHMTDQQVADYARGALDPSKMAALAKATDEMMGNFRHLTPGVRSFVQTYSPFGLWWLNSMRFLARMPFDHPIKTGVLAALYNATQSQREEDQQAWMKQHPGQQYPGYLEGGIHVSLPDALGGGGTVNPTYYSPPGIAIQPLETAGSMVLPQVQPFLRALAGVNDFGQPLSAPDVKGPKGKASAADQATVILNDLLENTMPGARMARQIAQLGGSQYDTATLPGALLDRAGVKVGSPLTPATRPGPNGEPATRSIGATLVKALGPERLTFDTSATKQGGAGGGLPDWSSVGHAGAAASKVDWGSVGKAPAAAPHPDWSTVGK